jgi:hypothetical protein
MKKLKLKAMANAWITNNKWSEERFKKTLAENGLETAIQLYGDEAYKMAVKARIGQDILNILEMAEWEDQFAEFRKDLEHLMRMCGQTGIEQLKFFALFDVTYGINQIMSA